MTRFDYTNAPYPVRPDLALAYRAYWEKLSAPGSWWTGAERVAIADEARRASSCALCAERKAALSPFSVDGEHDHGGQLPDAAVDAVHRLVSDASRLSKSWLEKLQASGLSDAQYVELLGVVVAVISIDSFHTALGFELEPLPTPQPGDPSRYRPASARPGDAWVAWIPADQATGAEADLYGGSKAPNVAAAMSLVPDAVRAMKSLSAVQYTEMAKVADPTAGASAIALDRRQVELVAGRVSALNECFY
jgi:alkylhydroperoxidase family enzyme